jgi:hypothetical protein
MFGSINLVDVLSEVPDEIKPIIGTLYYHRFTRAKLLISDLGNYVVRELQKPFYACSYLGPAMTEGKARGIFTALDIFLTAHGYYHSLGSEVQALLQTAREVAFSNEGFISLRENALALGNAADVQQAFDAYMDLRAAGQPTCFYCDRPVDEDGADTSTEYGVLFGCDGDWRLFGNPDSYI